MLRRSLACEQAFKARLLYLVPNNRFQSLEDLLDFKVTFLDCSLIAILEQSLALGVDVNAIKGALIGELGVPTFQKNFWQASYFPATFDLEVASLVNDILSVRSTKIEARVFGLEKQDLIHTDTHRNRTDEADSLHHTTDPHTQGTSPAGTHYLSNIESTQQTTDNVEVKSELPSPIEAQAGSVFSDQEEEQERQRQGQGQQKPQFIDWLCPKLIDSQGRVSGVLDRESSPAYSLSYSPCSTPSLGNSSDRELSPLSLRSKHWKKRIVEASESEDSVLDTEDTRRFLENYNKDVELNPSLGLD